MSIRVGNSCVNCNNIGEGNFCSKHEVKVSTNYTCDSFEMKQELKNNPNCSSCVRYLHASCANPQKAAPNMLCSQWAPMHASA